MKQANPEKAKLFDREKIARNFMRHNGGKGPDFITEIVLEDLAERLAPVKREFSDALIIAPDITHVPKTIHCAGKSIEPETIATLVGRGGTGGKEVRADEMLDVENPQLPARSHDLIISLFDLGFTDNVPRFIHGIKNALVPDGLFLAAFIGGSTLGELRHAWLRADSRHLGGAIARIAPFIDIKDAGALLQSAGFAMPVTDREILKLSYASPMHLMAEIKALGASNPLVSTRRPLLGRQHLASAIESYPGNGGDRIIASLEIIWMSGWAPHESQQKPLRPGSAQVSLSKILGDRSG